MEESICVEWKNLNYTVKKRVDRRFWQWNRFCEADQDLKILDNGEDFVGVKFL
jgi:hypothetical protein